MRNPDSANGRDAAKTSHAAAWPELPYPAWKDTCTALQLWTQIVGKVRLTQTPWLNHSWHVVLFVSASGLTTGSIPHGDRAFEINFDFIEHRLTIRTSDGGHGAIALEPQPVADFYAKLMRALAGLGISVAIYGRPSEIPDAVPFAEDRAARPYDADYANRFWRVLVQAHNVMARFRTRFLGKASPVHFFWGGMDLAVTRFSGREAPLHPGGVPGLPDRVAREAYSHEVSSAGFWPGGGPIDFAAFYSYAYPEPKGFSSAKVLPETAFYHSELREFVLPYDAVRTAPEPGDALMNFLQSTYEAAADAAHWDRAHLECLEGQPGRPRLVR